MHIIALIQSVVATVTNRPADSRIRETQILLVRRLGRAVQSGDVRITGTAVYRESVAAGTVIQIVSRRSSPLTAYAASKKITLGIIGPRLGTGLGADGKTRRTTPTTRETAA